MATDDQKFDDMAQAMKYARTRCAHNSKSRWLGYAAAGAAGAAALATGQQADAATVVNMGNLDLSGGPFTLAKDGQLALDLDNNGSADVTIKNGASVNFSYSNPYYGGRAYASGSILGRLGQYNSGGGLYNYAINFSRVSSIGSKFTQDFVSPYPGAGGTDPYASRWDYTIQNASTFYMRDGLGGWPLSGWGSWGDVYANNVPGFLGVRFDIGGATHYGFVEMEIDRSILNDYDDPQFPPPGRPANVAKILSYGYEDVADAQISGPGDANFVRNDLTYDEETGDLLTIETNWFHAQDDVDGADFLQWQRGFGMADPTQRDGDANRDGTVDGADLALWESQFGDPRRSPAPALGSASSSAVPEPNSLGLMALGATGLMALRRIRRARRKPQEMPAK